MLNSIGATRAGVGTVPKLLSGMRSTSAITVMPPPGHREAGAPPQLTWTSAFLMARVSSTGFSVTPARRLPPAPPRNSTELSAASQFWQMRCTMCPTAAGIGGGTGLSWWSSRYQPACSPVVDVISRRKPGQARRASQPAMMASGAVKSGLRHLEVAPRGGFAPAHAYARGLHAQAAAGLVLGQHAGDVLIDHHHFIG